MATCVVLLERLASGLGVRFIVDVAPSGRAAAALPPDEQVVGDATSVDGTRLLVAAGEGRPTKRGGVARS